MSLDTQADKLTAFYKRLTEGGIPADCASVLTIDANKFLMAGSGPIEQPDRHDIAAAAQAKREARAAALRAQ